MKLAAFMSKPRETEKAKSKKLEVAKPKNPKKAKRRWWLRLVGSQKPKTVKVGRNDPCPCGSGKKYKKCCMKKRRT